MKLHVEEVKKIKNCIPICCAEGCSQIPLFHGTRMYALQVSEEERKRFYSACDRILSFAKELFMNCSIDDDILMEYQRTKNLMFLSTVVHQYKTSLYEYGSFYVTTSYPTAIIFANNAGGELGQWAYAQCIGFQDFQIDLDSETRDAAKVVMEEYGKYESSEKVILAFADVRFEDLQTERGESFLRYNDNGNPNEEYNAYMIGVLNETRVADSIECVRSFRLQKHETYIAYIIRQKDFKEGFSVFTEIRDVDKYLEWNDSKCLRELL